MNQENEYTIAVKQTIENLIQAGTSFDVDQLELIYHKDLQVIMIDEQAELMMADKNAFKNLFQTKRENHEAPLNTWALFNHIQANATSGHCLITRKVKLTDEERKLILSIDLVWQDERWQVTREVIFRKQLIKVGIKTVRNLNIK